VEVPDPGEYVARGAARQAAWVLAGTPEPPPWVVAATATAVPEDAAGVGAAVRAAYAAARDGAVAGLLRPGTPVPSP
jgi:xylulokinase